jgi:hypothetical protein
VEAVVELVQAVDPGGLGLQQEPLADDPVQSLLLASALGSVGLAVDEVDAQHRAAAVQCRIRVRRAVVHIQGLGQPAAHDRGAECVLAGAGVLLIHPAAMDQQPGVVVHQHKQSGALGAGHARVRHERSDEHVADPALAWPLGLIAAGGAGRLGRQCRAGQPLAGKMGAHGAFADGDAMAGAQDLGDLRRGAGRTLGTQRGCFGEQLGMAAHRAGVGAPLRSQPVQAAGLPGGNPAVQRAAAEGTYGAVGVLVGLAGQRADQPATLGRRKTRVGGLGDHPEAEQGDLLGPVTRAAGGAGGWVGHGASFGAVRADQEPAASNPAPHALPRAGSWWPKEASRR